MANNLNAQVISNEEINDAKLLNAKKIILQLQDEMNDYITQGSGPFLAAVIDENGTAICSIKYDEVEQFYDGVAAVRIDERWGLIDKTGKEIIQQALRTENGEITHIGTNEKILKLKNRKTTLFDLNGKSLFPAFVEKNLEKENIMKEVFYQMKEISKKGYWNDSHEKLALFLEGFRSLTIKPAIENNEDKNIGSIKVGKLANFIILDKNPLLYNPANYNEIEVYTTVLEGRLIH